MREDQRFSYSIQLLVRNIRDNDISIFQFRSLLQDILPVWILAGNILSRYSAVVIRIRNSMGSSPGIGVNRD